MTCQMGAAPRVRYGDTRDINQPAEPYCFAHKAYVGDGVCDKARIAELEATLRRIADPSAWSFVQVDNEASNTLNQQLVEMQRIAAEALST
jgi:hypothetical protein